MSDDQPDEGRQRPSVPDAGQDDPGTTETSDGRPEDGQSRDPAGVGGELPDDDSTGLSGQPNTDTVPADWSDVDDAADSSTGTQRGGNQPDPAPVDAGAEAFPQDGATGASNRPLATAEGQAGVGPQAANGAGTGGQRGPGEKFCSNCGSVIDQQAVVCPECGVEQDAQRQQGGNSNDAGIAALLAAVGFVVPLLAGAGQFYNGDIGKGIIFTLIQLLNVGLAFLLVGLVTYPLVAVVAIWDAYSSASR